MPKKIELIIKEEEKVLKKYLRYEGVKNNNLRDRLSMLLLIQKGKCQYKSDVAKELGRNRRTVEVWMQKYERGGIKNLLELKNKRNARRVIPVEIKKLVIKILQEPNREEISFIEIYNWINLQHPNKLNYNTLYKFVTKYKKKSSRFGSWIMIKGEKYYIPGNG